MTAKVCIVLESMNRHSRVIVSHPNWTSAANLGTKKSCLPRGCSAAPGLRLACFARCWVACSSMMRAGSAGSFSTTLVTVASRILSGISISSNSHRICHMRLLLLLRQGSNVQEPPVLHKQQNYNAGVPQQLYLPPCMQALEIGLHANAVDLGLCTPAMV